MLNNQAFVDFGVSLAETRFFEGLLPASVRLQDACVPLSDMVYTHPRN